MTNPQRSQDLYIQCEAVRALRVRPPGYNWSVKGGNRPTLHIGDVRGSSLTGSESSCIKVQSRPLAALLRSDLYHRNSNGFRSRRRDSRYVVNGSAPDGISACGGRRPRHLPARFDLGAVECTQAESSGGPWPPLGLSLAGSESMTKARSLHRGAAMGYVAKLYWLNLDPAATIPVDRTSGKQRTWHDRRACIIKMTGVHIVIRLADLGLEAVGCHRNEGWAELIITVNSFGTERAPLWRPAVPSARCADSAAELKRHTRTYTHNLSAPDRCVASQE
ncbi:hypothetical protein BD779DRAFT_1786493 [Infundibulicybe gibba]|nr:hypothetical protein BD779DRAFT_1786493 [Infundibulicybe gibba]